MKISIITVNYNTESHIKALLANLNLQTMSSEDFEVIVVNNSQNDNLHQLISSLITKYCLRIIQSNDNIGFGRANNLGARNASGEFLLFINPDVLVDQEDYLERLYQFARINPQHGIVSTRVIDGTGVDSGPFESYAYGVNFDLPGNIAAVIGALMFIKKDIFDLLNGFDPDFFLYDEESDLCLRVRQQGFSIHQINELSVHHAGGVSEEKRFKYEYWIKRQRGLYLFCSKHYSPEKFRHILLADLRQARYKIVKLWFEINLLQMKRKISRYEQWRAIYYSAKKTLLSTEWLIYKNDAEK